MAGRYLSAAVFWREADSFLKVDSESDMDEDAALEPEVRRRSGFEVFEDRISARCRAFHSITSLW